MFDYTDNRTPSHADPVWDHGPLSALGPAHLSTFSYSILAEILRRGWFDYYMQLGFEPQPAARLVRQHQGKAYLNLTLSAQLEAVQGIAPLTLRINGQPYPLAATKSGLFSGLLGNRKAKKVWSTVDELVNEAPLIRQKARTWFETVMGLKWSQAEILQVMEQIERVGADSMRLYFAARHNLELGFNEILWALEPASPFPQSLGYASALYQGLGNTQLSNLIESDISSAVLDLAQLARNEGISMPDGKGTAEWSSWLEHGKFKAALTDFTKDHGHRCAGESELKNPRWEEDPNLLLGCVLALANRESTSAVGGVNQTSIQEMMQIVDAKERKNIQVWLDRLPKLFRLQSQALDAFAYILAGSRRWIQAAAQEAMSDGRLQSRDEAFYFQLEELKEMMTGEWNVSNTDEIRARLAERQAEFAQSETNNREQSISSLLIGDQEVHPTRSGLPTSADLGIEVSTPTDLTAIEPTALIAQLLVAGPALKVASVDGGTGTLLPLAGTLVTEGGHLLDPVVAAAYSRGKSVIAEA
ncbi:MAG: hypothetical protein AAF702_42580 [Chloroflexota bacterium]